MHQFKEKSERQRELVSAGLFFYPVLQAADVLAYRADEVPVGEDQRQHIELMREIARRFNERFGEVLVLPEHRIPATGAKVMDLQEPERKMSTTVGADSGRVYLLDEPDAIRSKFGSAVTDSGREILRAPDKAGISNMIGVLAVATDRSEQEVEAEFAEAGYGDFKKAVAEAVVEYLRPVREAYPEIREDEATLERILATGAGRAREMASQTLGDVRAAMGVGAPPSG
jgi:tryptophanyl-tRNA synthetase